MELEGPITKLWERALGREGSVGLDDNFFDLGGDSLQLIEVHSELQKLLPCELCLTDLFEYTTVRSLASRLAAMESPARSSHEPAFSQAEDRARKQREAFARQRHQRATR
jgi:acyl carrier protein